MPHTTEDPQPPDPTPPRDNQELHAFGDRLRLLRQQQRLSQAELAARSNGQITRSGVQKLEAGDRSPGLHTIHALARALGIDPQYFFREDLPPR